MIGARPYVLLILLFVVPASSDDTIDILKQTLGRLNMAYQKVTANSIPHCCLTQRLTAASLNTSLLPHSIPHSGAGVAVEDAS